MERSYSSPKEDAPVDIEIAKERSHADVLCNLRAPVHRRGIFPMISALICGGAVSAGTGSANPPAAFQGSVGSPLFSPNSANPLEVELERVQRAMAILEKDTEGFGNRIARSDLDLGTNAEALSRIQGGIAAQEQRESDMARAMLAVIDQRICSALSERAAPAYLQISQESSGVEAQFEIARARLISTIQQFDLSEVEPRQRIAMEAMNEHLIEQIRGATAGSLAAHSIVKGEGKIPHPICSKLKLRGVWGVAASYVCEKAVKKGIDKLAQEGIELTKEQYKKAFKDLPPHEAIDCVVEAIEVSTGKWLESNVNMCTLAPQIFGPFSELEGLQGILCPNYVVSFDHELKQCVDRKMKEIEEERKRNESSGERTHIDKGPKENFDRPNREKEPQEKPKKEPSEKPRREPIEKPTREPVERPTRDFPMG